MYYYNMLRLFSVFAGDWHKTRVIAKNKYEVLLSSLIATASCDHRELLNLGWAVQRSTYVQLKLRKRGPIYGVYAESVASAQLG